MPLINLNNYIERMLTVILLKKDKCITNTIILTSSFDKTIIPELLTINAHDDHIFALDYDKN